MPKMKMDRSFVVSSNQGYVISFTPNVEVNVPDVLVDECTKYGAVLVEKEYVPPKTLKMNVPDSVIDATSEREKVVLKALKSIIERGDRDEFTASGMPSAKVVSKEAGVKIEAKEVSNMWDFLKLKSTDAVATNV